MNNWKRRRIPLVHASSTALEYNLSKIIILKQCSIYQTVDRSPSDFFE